MSTRAATIRAARLRALSVQILRRVTQMSTLILIVWIALNAPWRNFKVAHNSSRLVGLLSNDTIAWMYATNERILELMGESLHVSEQFLGLPWGATVAGVHFTDPSSLAALLGQGQLPPLQMAVSVALPIALALVAGRFFCGWICPARLSFEIGGAVRQGLIWIGVPLPSIALPRIGLWVGLGATLFAASAGAVSFHIVLPYLTLATAIQTSVFTGAASGFVGIFATMVLVDALIAPGQICHSLCPTGALLEQLGRRQRFRLHRSPVAPVGGSEDQVVFEERPCPSRCDLCQRACPYGLFPGKDTHRPTCDTCGRCTMVCPEIRLSHRVRRAAPIAAMLLAAMALSPQAQAHHNKGLPHYGYFENYPQVPTEDYLRIVDKWEVGGVLFNFQGLERRTSDTPNDVKLFVYAYDLDADKTYMGPVTFELLKDGELITTFDRVEPDGEGVYITRETLPSSGEYELVFSFDDHGEPVRASFLFYADLAADQVNWWLLGGGGVFVSGIFGLALMGRRQRYARQAPASR